ncbi:aminoglycoside 6-adenylyltransferase [Desulfosporosinus orientis]|uniref:aminoglycoside 6-adenylyltransferase n=1 Tax=Desulfosporosinus orientis TaxID=1563 RepID=UPI00249E88F6|nr:aminoglycoside 6-adenylyltransferase [Desulfosporosinus orientis]
MKQILPLPLENTGKYMYRWLDAETWNAFLKTYSSGVVKDIWKAVFLMCELFDGVAKEVSPLINARYNEIEANNSLKFLKAVYSLPKDAKEIYFV